MKHCIINLPYNDLIFLKYKLPFYYKYFTQIIFIDYDIVYENNSNDGSIEFIKNFPDPDNKIVLVTEFKKIKDKIVFDYKNEGALIEEQQMMALSSKYIKDDIDIVWSIDLDEFFSKSLISDVEKEFKKDSKIVSIDLGWKTFIYNQYNLLNEKNRTYGFYPIRITRHFKKKIYNRSDWRTYGTAKLLKNQWIYHYSYIGYRRCKNKLIMYNTKSTSKHLQDEWLEEYINCLNRNDKYVNLIHPGSLNKCIRYDGPFLEDFDIEKIVNELNKIK